MSLIDKDYLSRFLWKNFFNYLFYYLFNYLFDYIGKFYRWLSTPPLDTNPECGANTYTKRAFAFELKERVKKRQSKEKIGDWAYKVFNDCVYYYQQKDQDFLNILHDVRCMEIEKEYDIYCKKLNEIADKLIKASEKY